MNNDVFFEILFYLCPSSLGKFARCCQNFCRLVEQFHKNESSPFTLCRWKYSSDKISRSFVVSQPPIGQFPLTSEDMSFESRKLGFSIYFIKTSEIDEEIGQHIEFSYKFYLYSYILSSFYQLDVDTSKFSYIYKRHFIEKKNWMIYHFVDKKQSYMSLVFDLTRIATDKEFWFIFNNCPMNTRVQSSKSKLSHCYDCHKNCPEVDVDELPYCYSGFHPLPDGDKLYLDGPSGHYLIVSELTGNRIPFSLMEVSDGSRIFSDGYRMFSDRYILTKQVVLENNQEIRFLQVLDVISQIRHVCLLDINAKQLIGRDFGEFSDIFEQNNKFYFSNKKLKNWFVLVKCSKTNQWSISLFEQSDKIILPTYCPLERRLIF